MIEMRALERRRACSSHMKSPTAIRLHGESRAKTRAAEEAMACSS